MCRRSLGGGGVGAIAGHQPVAALKEQPGLGIDDLPPRVQRALRFLINEQEEIPSINDVIVDLATALGFEYTPDPTTKSGKITKYPKK